MQKTAIFHTIYPYLAYLTDSSYFKLLDAILGVGPEVLRGTDIRTIKRMSAAQYVQKLDGNKDSERGMFEGKAPRKKREALKDIPSAGGVSSYVLGSS
jgi:hypothetical protein